MQTENFKYLGAVEIFLLSSDKKKVLLLKRSLKRKVLPGFIAGLGGKMDSSVLEAPIESAYREIEEESGIKKNDIISLELKSIITAIDKYGKWFVFEFVGILDNKFNINNIKQTDEGELAFYSINELENLNLIPDLKQGFLYNLLVSPNFYWVKSYFDEQNNFIKREIL
ncbi:MAG TPA: NUDIX domain-containing protein [bacterium]|nr:NUDIX domain-containing protein [bacterium]HOL47964.1 NUDIX domain-containing protein [bacterium]HPQ18048.1 NUDIX domain-containing protein [bacterium]